MLENLIWDGGKKNINKTQRVFILKVKG